MKKPKKVKCFAIYGPEGYPDTDTVSFCKTTCKQIFLRESFLNNTQPDWKRAEKAGFSIVEVEISPIQQLETPKQKIRKPRRKGGVV